MFFVIKMAYFALFCNFFLQRFAHFKKKQYFCTRFREVAQLVAHYVRDVGVACSSHVFSTK